MPIACWIIKAANTHSAYVILNAFPLQQWLHERYVMLVIGTWPVLLKNSVRKKIYFCCKSTLKRAKPSLGKLKYMLAT
jgi:hypothetical protein